MTAAGKVTVLHSFDPAAGDGSGPVAGLAQATDGNFYGVTGQGGGTSNAGVIFRISAAGAYSVLYSFDGTTAGQPEVGLLQHTNGILYGLSNGGGTYNIGTFYSLNVGLKPFVSLVTTSGVVGAEVEILGQGFAGTKSVHFGGVAASHTVVSDTYLTTIVPSGAKTGVVTVTTPGGTLKSNKKFRISPQFSSFNPASGPVASPVVIGGVSLAQTTKVTFGGVKATSFTVNSDLQVTANVPTGAKTGVIVVTTAGGTATSSGVFTVTP